MNLVKIGNHIFNMDKIFAVKYDKKGRGEGPVLTVKSENGNVNNLEIIDGDIAVLFWQYLCNQTVTEITKDSSETTKVPRYQLTNLG